MTRRSLIRANGEVAGILDSDDSATVTGTVTAVRLGDFIVGAETVDARVEVPFTYPITMATPGVVKAVVVTTTIS